MPGNPLNITLPTVGGTEGPSYATQVNAAIQALIDDIEAKVVPAEIDINADLSFQSGNTSYGATDLDRVNFDEQGSTLGSGNTFTLYTYNDELYYQDGTGTNVAITSGGSVAATPGNISTQGSPAYGSSDVELIWDGSNSDYVFKSGTSTYADILFRNAEFRNGANTMTMSSGVTSDYNVSWPAAGPSANDMAYFSGGGAITFSDTIPGAKTFSGALTASAGVTLGSNQDLTLQGTGDVVHGDRILVLNPISGSGYDSSNSPYDGFTVSSNAYLGRWVSSAGLDLIAFSVPLRVGDRIKSIDWYTYSAGVTTKTLKLRKVVPSTQTDSPVEQDSGSTSGATTHSWSLSSPYTITTGENIWLTFRAGAASDQFYGVEITYDRP